jgi:phosphotransferase system HPr-like phosphotransfer protein
MPSATTLCQLLALGLLVETRLRFAAQTQNDGTARRALENDGASFVTVEQTEAICG